MFVEISSTIFVIIPDDIPKHLSMLSRSDHTLLVQKFAFINAPKPILLQLSMLMLSKHVCILKSRESHINHTTTSLHQCRWMSIVCAQSANAWTSFRRFSSTMVICTCQRAGFGVHNRCCGWKWSCIEHSSNCQRHDNTLRAKLPFSAASFIHSAYIIRTYNQ